MQPFADGFRADDFRAGDFRTKALVGLDACFAVGIVCDYKGSTLGKSKIVY
jgi:hypothetical protein